MQDDFNMGMFKRRVGNTPLLRAKGLEKQFGMGKIYLKLEGTNPTGHKSDRIAHNLIKDAVKSSKDTLTIGTMGYLAVSLGKLAEGTDLRCVVYVPRLNKNLEKVLDGLSCVEVVETGGTYENAVIESRKNALEKGWYDANPGLDNTVLAMVSYSPIASEIISSLGELPDTVSVPVSSGSLLSGVHLGFRQAWSAGDIEGMPRIFGGSIEGKNAVVWAFERGLKQLESLGGKVKVGALNHDALVNRRGIGGQQALDALYDSNGAAYGLTAEEMQHYAGLLRSADNVRASPDSAAALGAFSRAVDNGIVEAGKKHVIVLSTGRTDISLQILKRDSLVGGTTALVKTMDKWLQRFSDPEEEILEALENAFDKGYVLGAFFGSRMVGICVLSVMEMDTFFQLYHLSYIAAEEGTKGRGVATMLLEHALKLSGGNLSLHVEQDNKKAIRLYKKMGMDIKYYRMVYKGNKDDATNYDRPW